MENNDQSFKSVLIVDDDLTLREMYEEYLKASGYTVLSAKDGEEGLKVAKDSKPSAILLDLMMPKMNGIEVLKHLKANNDTKNIPVIVFTALIQDLEKQESLAAGASDYVVKTEITPKSILDKIQQLTSNAPMGGEDSASVPTQESVTSPMPSPAPEVPTSVPPVPPPPSTPAPTEAAPPPPLPQ